MMTRIVTILCIGFALISNCTVTGETMKPVSETALPKTPTKVQPSATSQPESTKRQSFISNVSYVPDGTEDQKLDLFLPKTGEGPFPTILAFHGGAFRRGPGFPSKSMYRKFGYHFSNLGYAFVSADYRLAPNFTYPAQIEDVFCALAWVHENHETYGLDEKNIIIMGDSAGGYLAAMLSTIETPEPYLENCPNKLPASEWIQGTVIFYGFFDITDVSEYPGKGSEFKPYMGAAWNDISSEKLAEMSPISWIDGSESPFLLIHGTMDTTIPDSMSKKFAEALENASVQVELLLVEADHKFVAKPVTSTANSQALKAIDAFLSAIVNR